MKRKPCLCSFTSLTDTAARVVLGVQVGTAVLTLGADVHAQAILYVDAIANGPTIKSSCWCSAYPELTPALSAVSAEATIRVAGGGFYADTVGFPNPRQATFHLKNGVTLVGVCAGCGAPDPNPRDSATSATPVSGDVLGSFAAGNEFRECCNSTYLSGCPDSLRPLPNARRQPGRRIRR